jgi:hypothetical protein
MSSPLSSQAEVGEVPRRNGSQVPVYLMHSEYFRATVCGLCEGLMMPLRPVLYCM